MIQFKASLRDINFLINDVFDFQSHYKNIPGGDEGCQFNNGGVTTPAGFKEAYQQYTEGGRAMLYYAATFADKIKAAHSKGDMKAYEDWDDKLGFLTPIMKAGLTELGYEAANHGVQVFGGHGFIKEWGMEQIMKRAMIGWRLNTFRIAFKARKDRDMVGSTSVDYLMY